MCVWMSSIPALTETESDPSAVPCNQSACLALLSECSSSSPLKEPFLSPCGRPSRCPSLFSRLASLCGLSVFTVLHMRLTGIYLYSHERVWMLELLPSHQFFLSRWASPSALHIAFHQYRVLTHIWQRSGSGKVAWPIPLILTFFQGESLPALVFFVSLLTHTHTHFLNLRSLRKEKHWLKGGLHYRLISFALVLCLKAFPPHL